MKREDLKNLIREEILKLDIDFLLENYTYLHNECPNEWFGIGWVLLTEYRVNLSNIYDSSKVEDNVVIGYEFFTPEGERHLSLLQKGTDIVKIGPALAKEPSILKINFKKRTNGADDKLLSTHINNIFNIITDNKLKSISFTPEDDKYKEVRKRLFINIINRFKDDIENVKTDESGATTLIFK